MLNKFSEAIRGNLAKLQRSKVVALVTIEVHARDIIEKLIKTGCNDVNAFDWLSQLRVYWDKVSAIFPVLCMSSSMLKTDIVIGFAIWLNLFVISCILGRDVLL